MWDIGVVLRVFGLWCSVDKFIGVGDVYGVFDFEVVVIWVFFRDVNCWGVYDFGDIVFNDDFGVRLSSGVCIGFFGGYWDCVYNFVVLEDVYFVFVDVDFDDLCLINLEGIFDVMGDLVVIGGWEIGEVVVYVDFCVGFLKVFGVLY